MSHIVDHPFTPKPGEEWGLCRFVVDTTDVDRGEGVVDQLDRTCGLAAPAHADVPKPYAPTATRPGQLADESGTLRGIIADPVSLFGGEAEIDETSGEPRQRVFATTTPGSAAVVKAAGEFHDGSRTVTLS